MRPLSALLLAAGSLALLSIAPSSVHALPEPELARRFEQELLPFCLDDWHHGTLVGAGGVGLAYASFHVPSPRGAVVIVPGRSQPFLEYCELVHDLRDSGYDFYLFDHRGQGWSERLVAPGERAYVDEFDDYLQDLGTFVHQIVRPQDYARVVAIAHSMGGGIVTRYAQLQPDVFDALILSAPMHAIDTMGYTTPIAYALAAAATAAGLGAEYAPTQHGPDAFAVLASSDQTHSAARWAVMKRAEQLFPELAMGGSTFRWVREAIEGTAVLRFWARTLRVPTLIFQAGDDAYVDNAGQDEVCALAARCTKRFLPGTFHTLLQERDESRDVIVDAIRAELAR